MLARKQHATQIHVPMQVYCESGGEDVLLVRKKGISWWTRNRPMPGLPWSQDTQRQAFCRNYLHQAQLINMEGGFGGGKPQYRSSSHQMFSSQQIQEAPDVDGSPHRNCIHFHTPLRVAWFGAQNLCPPTQVDGNHLRDVVQAHLASTL